VKIIEVIESKYWLNRINGRTASIYGAVPYMNETEKHNWSIESRGYTWRLDNGTIGLGRQPVKTREEALRIMELVNGGES
jgi:predicted GH43/DUF377 family glycosyl hydrolase